MSLSRRLPHQQPPFLCGRQVRGPLLRPSSLPRKKSVTVIVTRSHDYRHLLLLLLCLLQGVLGGRLALWGFASGWGCRWCVAHGAIAGRVVGKTVVVLS